jgi:hypothetical protein
MSNSRVLALVVSLFFAAPLVARDFNGFFTPEFVKDHDPPYIPVSATASLEIGSRILGELRLRELGNYGMNGSLAGSQLEILLTDRAGRTAGRAEGRLDGMRLELALQLGDRNSEKYSQGRLTLEASVEWRASDIVKESKKLRDPGRRYWFAPDFDDRDWEVIMLPDDNAFGDEIKHARYYRSRFSLKDANESVAAVFSSDDGIWIFINGRFLGHWGAKENEGGCVNDPLGRCGVNGTVQPVIIPSEFLRAGENTIAVKVNNGECCFTYFNLMIERVSARFLPSIQ